jgi:hypothetical protein
MQQKLINVVLGLILATILSGCGPHIIDKSYSLPVNEDRGLVMYSISWDIQDGENIIIPTIIVKRTINKYGNFSEIYKQAREGPLGPLYSQIDITQGGYRTLVYLQEWAAGDVNLTPQVATIHWKSTFKPIKVSVKPGKITYAGSFLFKNLKYEKANILETFLIGDRVDRNCSFKVQDQADRDFDLLRKNGPYIPERDIIREIHSHPNPEESED